MDHHTSPSAFKLTGVPRLGSLGKYFGVGIVLYFVYRVVSLVLVTVRTRRRYHDVPSLPRHWLLGNLIQVGEKMHPSMERHADYGLEEIWESLDRPGAFMIDISPVDTSLIILADPAIAEEVVQPSELYKYSFPKSDTLSSFWRLTGKESMLTNEGEAWKHMRKRFNKGFSPAHLHTLSPLVVDKTRIFKDRLKAAAATGEVFALRQYAQDLTTDIITTIAIEKDFGSQTIPDGQGPKSRFGFLTASRKLPGLTYKVGQGFDLRGYFDLVRPTKAWLYDRIQNSILDDLVRESLKKDRQSTDKTSAKAIVQLALSGLQPTDALIKNTRDQIKTFIFAGQDTSATAIQWICYELSQAPYSPRHARYLEKLRAEHDAVFGPSYFSALEVLDKPELCEQIIGDKLPYTTAFIKEILRVHPPGGSARISPEASKTEPPKLVTIDGKPTRIDGLRIYVAHWLIQRNPKIWGPDAHEFNPDRWMDEEYVKNLPAGAWRAFERGPRNCIGQELATIEMKVTLCAIARGFVFEKIGLTGRNGEKEMFYIHEVTAVPARNMTMKVRLRQEQEKN